MVKSPIRTPGIGIGQSNFMITEEQIKGLRSHLSDVTCGPFSWGSAKEYRDFLRGALEYIDRLKTDKARLEFQVELLERAVFEPSCSLSEDEYRSNVP